MGPAKAKGAKGLALEELLRLYFLQAGLFAVRGVPITESGTDVSDLDVWVYERPSGTMRRRIAVDAKARTKPRAAERLLWANGIRHGLGLDGAYVATPDKRPLVRDLARKLDISLLDGTDIDRIAASAKIKAVRRLTEEELRAKFRAEDLSRHEKTGLAEIDRLKASLVANMGVGGANAALDSFGKFGSLVLTSPPATEDASLMVRGAYFAAAISAIHLDFVGASIAFRPVEERRQTLISIVRFGSSDKSEGLAKLRLATALVREYLPNGPALAQKLERAFLSDADRIPAEVVADAIAKHTGTDHLFVVARALEAAAYEPNVPGFDALDTESQSFIGALLDFHGLNRMRFADAWSGQAPDIKPLGATGAQDKLPLDEPAKSA